MPILILTDRCDNLSYCFAAQACPNQALLYDEQKGQVVAFPERCGDCRGPCLNFCDQYALKYARSLEELRLLQAELDGSMSTEEIAQERIRLRKAEEERKARTVSEVTSASFQQQVLQSRLPVLLVADSSRSATWKSLAPILEKMSQQYVGRLSLRRLNVDTEPQMASAMRIRGVPTFLFFYQGRVLNGMEGTVTPTQLEGWTENLLEEVQSSEQSQAGGIISARAAVGGADQAQER